MLLQSLIKTKKVKETIFKAQVYNGSEKTRVKQHKILQGYLLLSANLNLQRHICMRKHTSTLYW